MTNKIKFENYVITKKYGKFQNNPMYFHVFVKLASYFWSIYKLNKKTILSSLLFFKKHGFKWSYYKIFFFFVSLNYQTTLSNTIFRLESFILFFKINRHFIK